MVFRISLFLFTLTLTYTSDSIPLLYYIYTFINTRSSNYFIIYNHLWDSETGGLEVLNQDYVIFDVIKTKKSL